MMAEQSENSQEISEEQQLKEQLESICLDYQLLVNKNREMAPKGTHSKKTPDPNMENDIDDDDLEGEWVISIFHREKKIAFTQLNCVRLNFPWDLFHLIFRNCECFG